MRHRDKVNSLGRIAPHRKAMMANMACSLIQHKRINTTVVKAKALRSYVDPIITASKMDSTHARRMVFRKLKDKHAVTELFREIAPKVGGRLGGYTRILKTGNRLGDAAEMCLIELVDFNENYLQSKGVKSTKTRRRRGAGKKKVDEENPTTDQIVDKESKKEVRKEVKQSETKGIAEEVSNEVQEEEENVKSIAEVEKNEQEDIPDDKGNGLDGENPTDEGEKKGE